MMDTAAMRERAVALMREALALLDEAGEDAAARHLQHAHDIAARTPNGPMTEEWPEALAASRVPTASDKSFARAIGGAIAVLGIVMARSGITSIQELADTMAIYGATTGERDPTEGLLIASWAAILQQVADHPTPGQA